ncbi:MAG: methyl-accepting chemotaxis protein [Deltaproteobacteria bacterium]|nr:methyl-accepting chemotaxis protein [Deltaproteobacteria bacterium]
MKIRQLTRLIKNRLPAGSDAENRSGKAAGSWITALSKVTANLSTLETKTEQDFLQVGEKLQDFHQRSTEMAETASRVLGLMTGEEFHRSISSLMDIIEELRRHLEMSRDHSERTSQVLGQYYDTLCSVSSSLEDFKLLVLNLRMLGFFTRVENVHLFTSDSGFSSLTDDVKNLSESVREKSIEMKRKTDTLLSTISQTLSDMTAAQKMQGAQTEMMLQHIESNHTILSTKTENATSSAHRITQSIGKITGNIEEIVSGLQFHDITRQQISHAREALEGIVSDMEAGQKPWPQLAGIALEICSLQALQLSQSQNEFFNAVESILGNLGGIARNVREIMREANAVAWASDYEGIGFMEEIGSGISSVLTALDQDISEQTRLTSTIRSVSDMVSEMSYFVKGIDGLGLKLQLIALNARIKAAHIGSEGAALDTISGSIYELSKNSRSDTLALSNTLAEVGEAAQSFGQDLAAIQEDQQGQVERLMNSLQSIIASLHEVNTQVMAAVTDMNNQGESLAQDITAMISQVTVHQEVNDALKDARQRILRVVDEIEAAFPDHDRSADETCLQTLDGRYTMESERDVHIRHVGREAERVHVGLKRPARGDLGENVELF